MDFFEVRELFLPEAKFLIYTDLDDYPVAKQAKKLRLKVKEMPGKGDGMYGPDAAELDGNERDIVKYAQEYLGFEGRTFRELEKERKDGYI